MSATICGQSLKYEKIVPESLSNNILSITGMMRTKMLSDRDYGTLLILTSACIVTVKTEMVNINSW